MNFNSFGFKKPVNDTLKTLHFLKPTPIQEKTIPLLKKKQNIIALSHTGTGKTHAFLLPIFDNLNLTNLETQAVILVPTRELGKQIYNNCKDFIVNFPNLTIGLFVGGDDLQKKIKKLEKTQPTIVIGTPNNLKDLYDQKILKLTTANIVIADEVDMIFDFGFIEDTDYLLSKMSEKIQMGFFSATISQELQQYLKKYLVNAHIIDDTKNQVVKKNIQHYLIETKNRDLEQVFAAIVETLNPYLCLVFVSNKNQIALVTEILRGLKVANVGELHGNLDAKTRNSMLKRLCANQFKYVIVSDVVARGLDFRGVSDVISVNLPVNLSYYIHRAGRTGRNGTTGKSYVLNTQDNKKRIDQLKQLGIEFQKLKLVDNHLVEEKVVTSAKKKLNDPEVQMIISRYKKKKVRPKYKQKRKEEIQNLQNDRRRQHIKESIKKLKKEKYKKRRDNIFNN